MSVQRDRTRFWSHGLGVMEIREVTPTPGTDHSDIGYLEDGLQSSYETIVLGDELVGVLSDVLDLDLDPVRAKAALGRRDHGAAIAGAEVDHVILRRHPRQVQHLVGQRLRSRNPYDVLTELADRRFIPSFSRRRLSEGARSGHDRQTQHQQ